MKRILLTAILIAAVFLTACSPVDELTPTVAVFTEAVPETEAKTPAVEWISQEQAMIAGYVVMQNGDARHNQQAWMDFLKSCDEGKTASVRLIQFWEDNTQNIFDISFDGTEYTLCTQTALQNTTAAFSEYIWLSGELGEDAEPYDRFLECAFSGEKTIVLYKDLIAEPDYSGLTDMNLHLKEGEPPLLSCGGETCNRLLELLTGAQYMLCPPEEYLLGVKLICGRGEKEALVLEMDLNQGIFRFGEQYYRYGETCEALLEILGWEEWPDDVRNEYGI